MQSSKKKEHYISASKSKFSQGLILGKCLSWYHITLNTFLYYQFPLPWSRHPTVRWGNFYQEKQRVTFASLLWGSYLLSS